MVKEALCSSGACREAQPHAWAVAVVIKERDASGFQGALDRLQHLLATAAGARAVERPRQSVQRDAERVPLARSPLQALVALAVVPTALLDPLGVAQRARGLGGVVAVQAGVHPRLAGRLLGVLRVDSCGVRHRAGC